MTGLRPQSKTALPQSISPCCRPLVVLPVPRVLKTPHVPKIQPPRPGVEATEVPIPELLLALRNCRLL